MPMVRMRIGTALGCGGGWEGGNDLWLVIELTTGRFRCPTGTVRPSRAMGLHIWIRRQDVDLFGRRREVVVVRPRERMARGVVGIVTAMGARVRTMAR